MYTGPTAYPKLPLTFSVIVPLLQSQNWPFQPNIVLDTRQRQAAASVSGTALSAGIIGDFTSCETRTYGTLRERAKGPAALGCTTQPLIEVSSAVTAQCVLVLALTVAFGAATMSTYCASNCPCASAVLLAR